MPYHDVGAKEAAQFARYLFDRDPPAELIERYVAATSRLFPESPSESDTAILAFVREHPSSLPYIDAAAGLVRPGSLLRQKLLLMAAILEASPAYSAQFFAPPPGPMRTAVRVISYGIRAGIKFVIGWIVLTTIRPRA